jgi:hypothetical protein
LANLLICMHCPLCCIIFQVITKDTMLEYWALRYLIRLRSITRSMHCPDREMWEYCPPSFIRGYFNFSPPDLVWSFGLQSISSSECCHCKKYIFQINIGCEIPSRNLMSIAWLSIYFWPSRKLQPKTFLKPHCPSATFITTALHAGLRLRPYHCRRCIFGPYPIPSTCFCSMFWFGTRTW